jgi:hypothetical protein
MSNQLRYFQEDMCLHLQIIMMILLFGFGYETAGKIMIALCFFQYFYAAYWKSKMKKGGE